MPVKIFFTIFTTVLLAELGDKTQLATLLFAANKENSRWMVFLAAAAALVASTAIAVLLGSTLEKYIAHKYLSWLAGIGFVLIGLWCIVKA